jgi:CotH kinase protein/Lamin Tail Domain
MRVAFPVLASILLTSVVLAQHPAPQGDADWDAAGAAIFLPNEVTQILITMDEADLDAFIVNTDLEAYANCTVRITNSAIDETILDVGIRPRGGSQRDSRKFPWKLSFREFVVGRKVHGLEKLNLAGEATDPSLSRESLAYEIQRNAGVAATRTAHAWVQINDGTKVRGVYNMIQPVDEEFVQAWFGNKDGDLYKCRWKSDGAKLLWVNPGDAAAYEAMPDYEEKITGSYVRLAEFIDFVNLSDDPTFRAGINSWINVDSFLRAQAVDMYLGGWDGIWILPNNYYLYWDTATERFEYIPWDLDHTFGMDYFWFPFFFGTDWARRPYRDWGAGGPASAPGGGNGPPIIDRLLKIVEYDRMLQEYVREIARDFGHPERLRASAETYADMLESLAYTGSFSGSTADNGYTNASFRDSWELPSDYSSFSIPATWGVLPYARERSLHIRDQYPIPTSLPAIVVNEVLAKNTSGVADEAGELEDWIELHNTSNSALDLGGYFLSDRYGDSTRWEIPAGTSIAPRGSVLIWADEDLGQGPLHANFKLSKEGEGVYLFAPLTQQNVLINSLLYPGLDEDQSFARLPDGSRTLAVSDFPTAAAANRASDFALLLDGFSPDAIQLYAVGAEPSKPVAFVYSFNPGSWTIPGGLQCAGLGLELGPPVAIGAMRVANPQGIAAISLPVDYLLNRVYLQAIDVTTCATTSLRVL